MVRYFLKLAYDGSAYHGWQIQPNAVTVQAILNSAITTLLRVNTEVTGCGRTDTGVHAMEYVAHFDALEPIENSEKFLRSMNALLPRDIAVQQLIPVQETAHARFDATGRTYEYHVVAVKNPFLQQRAGYWPYPLDIKAMNSAAAMLMVHTAFGCFCKGKEDDQSVECRVTFAQWHHRPDRLVFTITANRFIRNMVRAIVGTLLEVGEGKLSLAEFRNILDSGDRSEAGASVPAHGLYLVRIDYPFLER